MAGKTFRCRVVTPTEQLMDADCTYACVPAWDGLFGVMAGRAPIVASLGMGELRIDFPQPKGGSRSFFVDGGVCRMSSNELTIIAEAAIPAERLVVADAKAELNEANARRAPADAPSAAAKGRISHERARARAKLRLAERSVGKAI